jgi:hypothetical protein
VSISGTHNKTTLSCGLIDKKGYNKMQKQTFYHENTPGKVKEILESELYTNNRLRIFYGDADTGLDWNEEHDVLGYIGRSTGNAPITILLNNNTSHGGVAILTQCIVKITRNKQVLYQHPNYHYNKLSLGNPINNDYLEGVYQQKDDKLELVAQFKKAGRGQRWIDFLEGKRDNK